MKMERFSALRVWDVESGKCVKKFHAPGFYTYDPAKRARSIGGIRSLSFSADGAKLIVGGIDRSRLPTDPVATLKEILSIQQDLVVAKAQTLIASDDTAQRQETRRALQMIETSRDVRSLEVSGAKVLFPAEYTVRAESLIEARRLVGGIEIERVS